MGNDKLQNSPKLLMNLNLEAEGKFKVLIFDKIRIIGNMNGKTFDDSLINISVDQICGGLKFHSTNEILESFDAYFEVPPSDYFTLASMIHQIKTITSENALKQAAQKVKLENDKRIEALYNTPASTNADEILKKFKKDLENIAESKKFKFQGFPKPDWANLKK